MDEYYLYENEERNCCLLHILRRDDVTDNFDAVTYVLQDKLVPLPSFQRRGRTSGGDDEEERGTVKRSRLILSKQPPPSPYPIFLPTSRHYKWCSVVYNTQLEIHPSIHLRYVYQVIDGQEYSMLVQGRCGGTKDKPEYFIRISFFDNGSFHLECDHAKPRSGWESVPTQIVQAVKPLLPAIYAGVTHSTEVYRKDKGNEWHMKNYKAYDAYLRTRDLSVLEGDHGSEDYEIKRREFRLKPFVEERGVDEKGMAYIRVRYERMDEKTTDIAHELEKVVENIFYYGKYDYLVRGVSNIEFRGQTYFLRYFKIPEKDGYVELNVNFSATCTPFGFDNDPISSVYNKIYVNEEAGHRVYTVLVTKEPYRGRGLTTLLYDLMRTIYPVEQSTIVRSREIFPIAGLGDDWNVSDNYTQTNKVLDDNGYEGEIMEVTEELADLLYASVPTVKLHNRYHQLEPVEIIRAGMIMVFRTPEIPEWEEGVLYTRNVTKKAITVHSRDDELVFHLDLVKNGVVQGLYYHPAPGHISPYLLATSILADQHFSSDGKLKERWIGENDMIRENYTVLRLYLGEEAMPESGVGHSLFTDGDEYLNKMLLAVNATPSAKFWWAVGRWIPDTLFIDTKGMITISYHKPKVQESD